MDSAEFGVVEGYLFRYGYLKPEIKKTVDEIFRILSQNENISALYEKWCELERQKYKAYTQKEKEFPPLWENKVFQPVRNMIIRQVSGMEIRHYEIDSEKQLNQTENAMLTNTIFSLFTNLSRCIADDYNQNFNSLRMSVDRKLRRMIHDKKQALGQKEDLTHEQSY